MNCLSPVSFLILSILKMLDRIRTGNLQYLYLHLLLHLEFQQTKIIKIVQVTVRTYTSLPPRGVPLVNGSTAPQPLPSKVQSFWCSAFRKPSYLQTHPLSHTSDASMVFFTRNAWKVANKTKTGGDKTRVQGSLNLTDKKSWKSISQLRFTRWRCICCFLGHRAFTRSAADPGNPHFDGVWLWCPSAASAPCFLTLVAVCLEGCLWEAEDRAVCKVPAGSSCFGSYLWTITVTMVVPRYRALLKLLFIMC